MSFGSGFATPPCMLTPCRCGRGCTPGKFGPSFTKHERLIDVDEVTLMNRLITERPPESQRRIHVIAGILRELVAAEGGDEVEYAFTLVMAELSHG